MRLVVVTTPTPVPHEAALLRRMAHELRDCDAIHLRRPGWTVQQHRECLDALDESVRRRVVLHHAHELAAPLGLKGVHYTNKSRPALPAAAPVGHAASLSLHTLAELELPLAGMAYAFLSPIFDSISKTGYSAAFDLRAAGRTTLPAALGKATCPVIALGGITADRVPEAAALGFAGVAALGSVWQSADPLAECCRLLAACERA